MNTNAHWPQSSAAASHHAAVSPSLELCEARQARDGLVTLLRAERSAMADFLVALSDFDRRRGWEPLGHSSLFAFLVAELRLSRGSAYVRSSAARLLQVCPEVIGPLRDGRLCLSSVGELARVATPDNFAAVLPRFFGCSSREARTVAAAILPREAPPVRDQVTRLDSAVDRHAPILIPVTEVLSAPGPALVTASPNLEPSVASGSVRAHELAQPRPARGADRRDDIEPLDADLRRLHVTVGREFLRQLEVAREGLSHTIRGATTEQVLKAALDLLVEKQARARGQVKRPRETTPTPATTPAMRKIPIEAEPLHRRPGPREHIPAAVRRAVWERDQGRCVWPLDSGGCCGSTHRLELDHVVPWARGSEPTEDELRLLCRVHNLLGARQAFGARWMSRYARKSPVRAISTA